MTSVRMMSINGLVDTNVTTYAGADAAPASRRVVIWQCIEE